MKQQVRHNLETMANFYVIETNVRILHGQMFRCSALTSREMESVHDACKSALGDDCDRRTAIRAEIFAMLYFCQPEAIFRQVGVNRTVAMYVTKIMGLSRPNYSRYKRSLLFLYYHDKQFQTMADKAIDAVNELVGEK